MFLVRGLILGVSPVARGRMGLVNFVDVFLKGQV
jgi:hypothetical protein